MNFVRGPSKAYQEREAKKQKKIEDEALLLLNRLKYAYEVGEDCVDFYCYNDYPEHIAEEQLSREALIRLQDRYSPYISVKETKKDDYTMFLVCYK